MFGSVRGVVGDVGISERCSRSWDLWLELSGVCEVWKREKTNPDLAFLDISKAYYIVWWEGLWHKMRQYGVEEKFLRVCNGIYRVVEIRVVVEWRDVMVVCSGKGA